MVEHFFEILHYGTILIFGIYASAAFLGIRMNRQNIMILFVFSTAMGMINTCSFLLLGIAITEKIYPLIIHLPLILFFRFVYKYQVTPAVLSVTIAYLCCQISNWAGLFFLNFTHLGLVYYCVRIIINVVVLILLICFVSPAVSQLLQKPAKDIIIFGLMPLVYYLYDYMVTVYTSLFYSGGEVITEFLGFMLCIFFVVFVLVYFKQYEEKREIEQRNEFIEMQRIQSKKELERMKRSEYEMSILRHDMRHFLNDISGFIENGESERAQEYIHEVISIAENTSTKKYCSNQIVDMILSSYENRMKELEITFQYSIRIPKELGYSDSDISSILSNGLENAVNAVSLLEQDRREINLDMHINNGKLLISIKNTYAKIPKMIDGLPQAEEKGHGFGTQSIRYITEKLKGNCQFMVEGKYFMLRIVL